MCFALAPLSTKFIYVVDESVYLGAAILTQVLQIREFSEYEEISIIQEIHSTKKAGTFQGKEELRTMGAKACRPHDLVLIDERKTVARRLQALPEPLVND